MGIIARQATFNALLGYLGIGLGFVNVVLLYPKVLQEDQFGLTRLLIAIVTVTAQLAQLGAENTVMRYFPYFRDPERANRGVLAMLLLFGAVVSFVAMAVVGLGHGVLTDIFSDNTGLYDAYGLLVLPLVASEVFFILLRSYSRSLHRTVQPTFLREFVLRALQSVVILVQAWKPMSFGSFMVVYTSVFVLCTVLLVVDLYRAGHFHPGWAQRWMPRRLRRSITTYAVFTFSASVAGVILGNIDQLMIGALLKDALPHIAHYSVAFYFGSVIAAPGRALNQSAVPMLADAWKRNDMDTIRSLYARSSLVQTVVGGFLFLMVWVNMGDLFSFLDAGYAEATPVVLVIAGAYLLSGATGLGAGVISMSRSYRLDAWSSFAMLVVHLAVGFVLIRWLGVLGAAWGTFCSLLTVTVYRTWFLWRRYALWPFALRALWVPVLVSVLGCAALWLPSFGGPILDMTVRSVLLSAMFWPMAYRLHLLPELSGLAKKAVSFIS